MSQDVFEQASQLQERAREVAVLVKDIEQLRAATIGMGSGNQLRFQQVTSGEDVWPEELLIQVFFTGKHALLQEKKARLEHLVEHNAPPPPRPGRLNLGGVEFFIVDRGNAPPVVGVEANQVDRLYLGECQKLRDWLDQLLASIATV